MTVYAASLVKRRRATRDELRRLKAIEAAERESVTAFARTWRAA